MFFKSSNFLISDQTKDQFETIHSEEFPITHIAVNNKNDIYYTCEKYIHKLGVSKKNKCHEEISSFVLVGSIFAASDLSGKIKLFSKGIMIRNYDFHSSKVSGLELYNENILVSCSEDGTIKFTNIVKDKCFKTLDWFKDRIKCMKIIGEVLYVGLINGFIYQISLNTYEVEAEYNTGLQIVSIDADEDTVVFSSHNKAYKLGKSISQVGSHTKQITVIKIFKNKIYTVSLDGFFKTWSLNGILVSQVFLSSPILSFSCLDSQIYFALETGSICKIGSVQAITKEKNFKNKNLKEYEEEIAYKILEEKVTKDNKIEKLFKKFEHKGALKEALDKCDFTNIFAVLFYLKTVRKMKNAILFLEKNYLLTLLDFIINYFYVIELFEIFYEITNILLSVYLNDIYNDDEIYERICLLGECVDDEYIFQQRSIELYSYLECFE